MCEICFYVLKRRILTAAAQHKEDPRLPNMPAKEAERNACPLHPFVILCKRKKAFIRACDEYTGSRAVLTADDEKPAGPPEQMKTSTAVFRETGTVPLKEAHVLCIGVSK